MILCADTPKSNMLVKFRISANPLQTGIREDSELKFFNQWRFLDNYDGFEFPSETPSVSFQM